MDVLILSSIARVPMHGYELQLELRYRHVRWWAKAEHSHVYLALARLERSGDLVRVASKGGAGRARRVYALSERGRVRLLAALSRLGGAADETHFEFDLFLAGAYLLEREEVLSALGARLAAVEAQLVEARTLTERMEGKVPIAGELIMEHRVRHLVHEREFTAHVIEVVRSAEGWGPFLGSERIRDFIARTGVSIEAPEEAVAVPE
ncbi:MAG: PadR family transcriptional regulator [Deltaproteobacteria bacterium]|nr:PadR family transcriptional regulator [Deltaproteobacteria bacterium]